MTGTWHDGIHSRERDVFDAKIFVYYFSADLYQRHIPHSHYSADFHLGKPFQPVPVAYVFCSVWITKAVKLTEINVF